MRDFVIIGGGIGGTCTAALLSHQGYTVTLIEKEPYLGGCSSTFSHQGYRYNTGATTFAGYGKGLMVHEFFKTLNLSLPIHPIDPALCIVTAQGTISRFQRLRPFLDSLEKSLPHHGNEEFWSLVFKVNHAFYTYQNYYYSAASWHQKLTSLVSFIPFALKFWPYLLKSADSLLDTYLKDRCALYQQFIDAQLRIVAQTTSKNLNALSAILALGYTFLPNFYVQGGMGTLFDALAPRIGEIHTKTTVKAIETIKEGYMVQTDKGEFTSKNIVLNTPVFSSSALFKNSTVRAYFDRFKPLDNDQSAFMLYLTFASSDLFEHHYQLLLDTPFAYTTSSALFVSVSDQNDTTISPKGISKWSSTRSLVR